MCLLTDRCRLAEREALTELGPDAEAVRREDREVILFDLGLALGQADICVRTADLAAIGRCAAGWAARCCATSRG